MRVPVNKPYTITTQFGVEDQYAKFGRHSGIDYAGFLEGRTVYSPVDGTIVYAKDHSTGGLMLMVKDAKGNYHRLMHNSSFIKTSGSVKQGDPVARAGSTGLSTGVHVHHDICEVMWPTSFNQFFNPNTYNDKEEEMVTMTGLNVIYRFLLGQSPTQAGKDRYLGKVTFDEAYRKVKASTAYNARVKRIKIAKGEVNSHLAEEMR